MPPRLSSRASLLALTFFALHSAAAAADPATFATVRTFLATHCEKCHGEKIQKGGLTVVPFATEMAVLKQRKVWRSIAEQLTSKEMPPEGAKQPADADRTAVVAWISKTLDAADERDRNQLDPGRAVVRRLTAGEYNRTVRDVFAVDFDVAGAVGLPDDTVGESFNNLAAALNFSDALMEKYFAAADLVLERLFARPTKGPKPNELPPPAAKVFAIGDPKGSIERLLRHAYRRPAEAKEVARLVALYDRAAKPEDGIKLVVKAVLVSPHFLLRVERDRPAADAPYRVTDHELAVRLSYFLWSSAPDDELAGLADAGKLKQSEVYTAQVKRMLADPKAKALTDTFAEQWLQLKKLPDARPSTEFFPTFTPKLRQAMHDEAALFFDKLRTGDAPVTDLLAADYAYVNADLAKHYGIPNVTGPEFRKVTLTDPARGGLLGMGAVLAVTSHTNRTSPTLRGKYVLDVILGTPPPPPPPGVSQIDEAKAGKVAKNFREQLALHASQPSCAGCHAKIDPLGFGLENFDAIGRWRASGKEIDATGKLPGGDAFNGPRELKDVLLKRKARFVENVTEKILVFALGRELQPTDGPTVKAIAADLAKNEYKFSRLIDGVAQSYPFQYRRNTKPEDGE